MQNGAAGAATGVWLGGCGPGSLGAGPGGEGRQIRWTCEHWLCRQFAPGNSLWRGEGWNERKTLWLQRAAMWNALATGGGGSAAAVLSTSQIFWRNLGHPTYIPKLAQVCKALCSCAVDDEVWKWACEGHIEAPLLSARGAGVTFDLDAKQMASLVFNVWQGRHQEGLSMNPPRTVGDTRLVLNLVNDDTEDGTPVYTGHSTLTVYGEGFGNFHTSMLPKRAGDPEGIIAPHSVRTGVSWAEAAGTKTHPGVHRPLLMSPSYRALDMIRTWDTASNSGFAQQMYAARMASTGSEPPQEDRIGGAGVRGRDPYKWGTSLQLHTLRVCFQPYPETL